ncbi:MAG: hypothetical protein JNN07_05480 [Verrucomicrobiales bacterium]|nr:hypothetical protein [Verrucomicrobiales bacterium]
MNPEESNPKPDRGSLFRGSAALCPSRLSAGWSLAVLLWSLGSLLTQAQWTAQTIALKPGWNAVYLELDPEPVECDALFAGLPVESVWSWNRRFSSVQFIQDPDQLVPGQPEWLTWLPAATPTESLANLFTLRGGLPYLIKVRDTAAAFNWTVSGRPRVQAVDWISDSYNFVGFPISPATPPTFQAFFSGSTNQAGKPIYRLNTSGLWELISNPAGTPMRHGEAFWVRSDGRSTYSGPVGLEIPGSSSLTYGWQTTELTLRFKNQSSSPRTLNLKAQASANAPAGWPVLAGGIPFSYYATDLPNNQSGWVPLPAAGWTSPVLPPGGEWLLRVEARRRDLAPFAGTAAAAGALYQSVLELTDGSGYRQLIGVRAEGPNATGPQPGSPVRLADGTVSARAGLWVGNVVLQKVSQPSNIGSPNTPLPVANALQFRILIHVDESGQARLVQKVLQMWKPGTYHPDPSDPTQQTVEQPGRFVLVTDEALAGNWSGVTLRDGDPVPRRVSTVGYALKTPLPLVGAGTFGANTIGGSILLGYDDPLNPFKHKYHPDHDNLTERFDQTLPEGQESFTFTRQISLEFSSTDPEGLRLPGWGDTQLGGTYRETMRGVHRKPIFLQGIFRLSRASRVPLLNDGL